ncbi:MAG: hypothetical protein NTY09_05400 [bacterium]|nr:hypothetical protein [bacterium]
MDLLRFAHKRLDVFLSEIDRLLRSEFPYEDSRRAILRIQEEVKIRRSKVLEELKKREFKGQESAGTEAAEARLRRLESRAASESLAVLFESLPRLGFLLRSTNVRNAFEIYGPLCRLANQLLSPHLASRESRVQMVLSSEFNYSPFLDPYPLLDDFVLIGFPAPESSNPLLIPLAGHELGHAVWRKAGFENRFLSRVQQIVVKRIIDKKVDYVQLLADMKADGLDFAKLKDAPEDFFKYMEPAINWAMSQAEECFADFVGLRLFGCLASS